MINMKSILWEKAAAQLAVDFCCRPEDLAKDALHYSVLSEKSGQRWYHPHPYTARMVVLPTGGVVAAEKEMLPDLQQVLDGMNPSFLCEWEEIGQLQQVLGRHHTKIVEIHHVFLPEEPPKPSNDHVRVQCFVGDELLQFRDKPFPNALAFDYRYPDQVAMAGYVGDQLAGLAGASADSHQLWQIGVDVFPQFRGKGVGRTLVTQLREYVFRKHRVPFYGTCTSHIISQRLAASAGFVPAWVEVYTQPTRPPVKTPLPYAVE